MSISEHKTYRFQKILAVVTALFFLSINSYGFSSSEGKGDFNAGEMIMHHIGDAHEWHFWDGAYGTLPLPVILYSPESGLDIFMSSKFEHGHASYKGYTNEDGHIVAEGGKKFYDISITKNVAQLFINVLVIVFIFVSVANAYKKRGAAAPKGLQSIFEPIIIFVRDDIAKPNIGSKYEKFLPYLLTLFFFFWLGNMLGLVPGAANLTGNIAITAMLALVTLILTLVSSNGHYWKHIFWPPGVPTPIKFIIVPVEIIGIFTKPFSLMIRLFVAITAGHIVLLSLLGLTFIFHSWIVGFGSSLIVLFIKLIELLVAAIQAYVFTLFSAMYIGMAMDEGH